MMTHVVGMICYIQNPDTPKHHQLTGTNNKLMLVLHLQISMLLHNFDTNTSNLSISMLLCNFDTNTSNLSISMFLSNFDMHPIFDVLFLLKVKKSTSQTTLGPCKLWRRRGAQNATFSFGNMFPTTLWLDDSIVFFLLKNFVHDFIILIHLKSYTYNWGICKSSSYNSQVAQFSISYLFYPSSILRLQVVN